MDTSRHAENVELAGAIFAEYADFIRAVIRSQVKDETRVDDLFQDFFLSLVHNPLPENIRNTKSYLYRAITNDIVDAVRRVKTYGHRVREYSQQLNNSINKGSPEDALTIRDQVDRLLALVQERLSDAEFKAVSLRFRTHLSVEGVADRMGVKVRSASRYVCMGLKRIRRLVAAERGSCDDSL